MEFKGTRLTGFKSASYYWKRFNEILFWLTIINQTPYPLTMRINNYLIRILFGVILFSSMFQAGPIVSPAQANRCCKKFCLHMPGKMAASCHDSLRGLPLSRQSQGNMDCCKEGCASAYIHANPESPALVTLRDTFDSPNTFSVRVALEQDGGFVPPNDPPGFFHEPWRNKIKISPLFLTHSSLLL